MGKAYVLIYSDQIGSREDVKAWADKSKLVITWRYNLPHCFYLISNSTATELANDLRSATGETGRFLITEVSDNRYGWLDSDTWYLLRHKKKKPKT
jgi:hypothetical protein